ncbi:uncharacterized protein AB675_6340 [Cyphellophora attinorum]|uniref:6-methylsalicylate decarboxylase n=1 Tax=Cyphellophora attinorum TaxID=1664694 RepID=A0A0N1HFM7_9EURO|nr:uncharacterized protein AB675_6340 [Phialophora attinorum]KPI44075.1 hypothetical protein AB675_6340 [Phialophora attinorum]
MAKIDVHAHFLPPFYSEACRDFGHAKPDGMPTLPEWSASEHLGFMQANGITKSILSISSPGVHIKNTDDAFNRSLARDCNDYASELCSLYPEKFGFWASLPLPDLMGTIEEIDRVVNTLDDAVGFCVSTNHHGIYLGDSAFDKVMEKLNAVQATVFIHPTSPCIRHNHTKLQQDGQASSDSVRSTLHPLPQFPNPMLEFMFETTRSVINLLHSGTVTEYPDIVFVVPHAGAVLPPILARFSAFSAAVCPPQLRGVDLSIDALKLALQKRFYFDLAGAPFPDQLAGLLNVVQPYTLLYGSDYPFTPAEGVSILSRLMERGLRDMFPGNDEAIDAILFGNAERLLQRKMTVR